MTRETIIRNRDQYIREFKGTGHSGVDHIISYLDCHHFFEAQCNGHDREPGGTANHSLWVLKFARESRAAILKEHPERDIPDDELVFTCLLHDVCDCNPSRRHGARSKQILKERIKGFTFTWEVLAAVNAHMHGSLNEGGKRSTANSKNKAELLHYLVHNSDHRAIEYGGGIPFDTEPKRGPFYRKLEQPATVYFNPNEHRYIWNYGGDIESWKPETDLLAMPKTAAKVVAYLYIRECPLEPDLAVMEDQNGKKALFVINQLSDMNGQSLMTTDRVGFDYTDFIFFLSHYPQYRASYVVGRKTNGKWGVISLKDQFSEEDSNLFRIREQLDYVYDDSDSAINDMKGRRYQIRVRHTKYYKKLTF